VADWIASSGLKLAARCDMDPHSDEANGKLTVSLWLAEKAGGPAAPTKRRRTGNLEAAQ
jgi:hypothetical protein